MRIELPNKLFISLLLPVLLYSISLSQTGNLRFDHLTLQDGLPSEIINCIYQDSFGLIWVGTSNGLIKYDGYDMTIFYPSRVDSNSRWVHSIAEDSKGNLWTAGRVLARYSRANSTFINFNYDKVIPFPFVDVNVAHIGYHFSGYGGAFSKILIDSNENLWIGTYSYGLYRLPLSQFKKNLKSWNFELVFHDLEIEGTNSINSIVEDINQNIWIGTNNGLIKILNGEDKQIFYQSVKSVDYNIKNHVTDIIVDDKNFLWLATFGNGLGKFNISNESFSYISLKSSDDPSGTTNSVYTVSIDNSGVVWCGMSGHSDLGGIVSFDPKTEKIVRHLNDLNKSFSIGPYKWWVNDIFIDRAGVMWLGYREGPLDRLVPEKNAIKYFSPEDYKKDGLINKTVYDFQPLNDFQTLILTGSGILLFDLESGSFQEKFPLLNRSLSSIPGEKTFLLDSKDVIWIGCTNGTLIYDTTLKLTEFINTNSIRKGVVVAEDENFDYWIGTFGDGLFYYNSKTKLKKHYRHDPNNPQTIKDDFINHIYNDNSGNIWLGSNGGWFTRFDKKTQIAENNQLNASYISKIGALSNDEVWVATGLGGFFIFNKLTKKIIQFSKDQGLPHEAVHGITRDRNGYYWVTTTYAVSKFDPRVNTFQSFNVSENNNLIKNSYQSDSSKIIFLSAANGFYYFNPDDIKTNPYPPKMTLTDFKIYNRSLINDKDSILTEHINVSKSITLNHDMNDFTIEFSALHFSEPLKNEYKYILENFDREWNSSGTNRSARYTSLPEGEYSFKVIGSNSDGVWATEPATLAITILPPWWFTWWAYMLYTIIFIAILSYLYYLQRKRLKVIHRLEMKEFETEKLKEVDQMKSKFFANISHEFRTPLTLIKGPIEKLIQNDKESSRQKSYGLIKRNSDRLLNLINELLDLSKLESGKMKLSVKEEDIVSFVKAITLSFESLAERNKIRLNITSLEDLINIYFDREKMQKIISNLLSNACKFTDEGGVVKVDIKAKSKDQKVIITVSDTGVGIPEEELPKIFDRFYQTDKTSSEGTGIGLSLTKELVEIHHGKIDVESKKGKGTTFTITLPLNKEDYSQEEIIYSESEEEILETNEDEYDWKTKAGVEDNPIVLIVEDNKDVREFIISILEADYNLIEAKDGEEGYNKAIEVMPDLILSDIMMPKLTGDKMCRKLKNDQITSHIPIILLTAKSSGEDKIEGLEIGADDYLIKPFDEKELLARINNLIIQRKNLREKYLREAEFHPIEVAVTSLDKKFIERVIKIVDDNISDTDFDVERFADELIMSRRQLYRKFNSILGEKPNDFIRKYRIKRAAELITQNYDSITQIAYTVGFNDVSYFSKCFKQIYNISPQQYEKSK